MKYPRPEAGLIIQYQFLFPHNARAGNFYGEPHPCLVLDMRPPTEDGNQRVLITPISHVEPRPGESAIRVPPEAASYVGLDDEPMWVKLRQLNAVNWPASGRPKHALPVPGGGWTYAEFMPDRITNSALEQAQNLLDQKKVAVLDRDILMDRYRHQIGKQEQSQAEQDHDQADDD